ncbi:tRNA threonylcarbamoyladenosine biosynthesis protein RimN [Halothiobacillus diazotrophicus]|uniref:Threonylcarbamoyl-AMP synthase n=1 Tax=Halothiobacillus diazotrophicus TaxID=1860122 RepID=A0A191ZIH0_9GAMM|nr:L-threonylcarbamoyladenylate synthase [Halothiobacillus diazotrophicus]ANJ67669.1 tRNA threonylcarbamoyladenosine biosynthesis protein RimN [Halothiobacillus diazotrophicus]
MPTAFQLRRAREIIQQGGVIAYPTEAVYGLGCDPANADAVLRLLSLKVRDWRKGVILIAADIDQLRPWVDLPPSDWQQLSAQWPGPRTWVVPASAAAPDWITGGRTEIAVRVTAHPIASALARHAGMALVSTSANPAQRPAGRSPIDVRRYFGDALDLIVSGPVDRRATPTAIRHWPDGHWLRT